MGALLCSVGHYVVLQKPQSQDNRLPPLQTLIMDFTMTHVRFGRSLLHPMGQLTNIRHSFGVPDPDGTLMSVSRIKIRHYHTVYLNHPDPSVFIPLAVDTTERLYDDFIRLFFLHDELCVSLIWRVLLVWSWRKRRLCGFQSPGPLILVFHTSSSFYPFTSSHTPFRSFPCTFSSVFSLVAPAECLLWPFIGFCDHHSFSVTISFPWPSSFFISVENKHTWWKTNTP